MLTKTERFRATVKGVGNHRLLGILLFDKSAFRASKTALCAYFDVFRAGFGALRASKTSLHFVAPPHFAHHRLFRTALRADQGALRAPAPRRFAPDSGASPPRSRACGPRLRAFGPLQTSAARRLRRQRAASPPRAPGADAARSAAPSYTRSNAPRRPSAA